jgi:arginase
VGVAAGLTEGTGDFEVVWFDAHPDLANTDETTSGYFDGSGVSMWNGECWKALLATVPGHKPLGLEKITYCGVRDMNQQQFEKLERSKAKVVYGIREGEMKRIDFAARLSEVLGEGDGGRRHDCLVNVDLDCLDDSIGKIKEYVAPGGLDETDLKRCLEIVAAEMTGYSDCRFV